MITGKQFNHILHASLFVGIFLLSQSLGGVAALILSGHGGDLTSTMLAALLTANVLGIVFFGIYCLVAHPADLTWSGTMRGVCDMRLRRRSLLVLLLAPPCIYLVNYLQELLPELPDLVGEQNLQGLMSSTLGLLLLAVVGPVCEELLFRGGVQRCLSRAFSPRTAIVCTALLFSIVHFNPAQMPGAFVLGLLLGYAYWWTGSLIAPICIHILNNSLACILGLLSPDDDSLIHFLGGPTTAAAVAAVSLFFLFILLRAVLKEGCERA